MIRGWCFAAVLAVAASCLSFTAYGQIPADKSGVPAVPLAPSPGALPAAEPVATPAGAPAVSPAAGSAAGTASSGLPADAPWFQRFLLPVPEANGSADDWLSCNRPGVLGNADYLNWSARRSGLDFAALVSTTAPIVTTATESLDFDRADGFRGGLGYRFGNGWNVAWTYTYFRIANQETAAPTLGANPVLIATQSFLDAGKGVTALPMTSVEADGALQVNIQDFEAEWSSCLNDTVGFRAFGGFRWAKIDQTFNMTYDSGFGKGHISLPNNMDAEGVRLGAEIQWRSSWGFRVFGRGAESILVADFRTRQHEHALATVVNPAVDIDVSGDTAAVVPVVEAAVGVAYAHGPWEFLAGYEMSDWFNLVQVNRPTQSLLLDGYFLRLSFSR